jgi:hypothetical protein
VRLRGRARALHAPDDDDALDDDDDDDVRPAP